MKTLSDFSGAFPGWQLWDYLHNMPKQVYPKVSLAQIIIQDHKIGLSSAITIKGLQYNYKRKYNAIGYFTYDQWKQTVAYYCPDFICLRCKKPSFLIPDHIISAKLGGSNFITNIQPICMPCNSHKKGKPTDYRPDLGDFCNILFNSM